MHLIRRLLNSQCETNTSFMQNKWLTMSTNSDGFSHTYDKISIELPIVRFKGSQVD